MESMRFCRFFPTYRSNICCSGPNAWAAYKACFSASIFLVLLLIEPNGRPRFLGTLTSLWLFLIAFEFLIGCFCI
jgi:hypothetical protein